MARDPLGRVLPVGLGHAESFEHRFGPQPPRREQDGGRLVLVEFVRERERHPADRTLGEVVEERDAVVVRVVLVRPVGHLDDQPAG
jgi:hypothetical protein